MAKVKYEAYEIGSKVFALNHYSNDGKQTNFITIYNAIVDDVTICYDKKTNDVEISYMLKTPDGEQWGDTVIEEYVSDSFDELVQRIKPKWLAESNTFGN